MTAAIGYARNATPPRNFASDRADYIADQALERAQGPYSVKELRFSSDRVFGDYDLCSEIADALNSGDELEAMRVLKAGMDKHRVDFYTSELEGECDK